MSNEDKFIAARIETLRDRVEAAIMIVERIVGHAKAYDETSVLIDAMRFLAESEDALAEAEYDALLNVESFLGYREKAS